VVVGTGAGEADELAGVAAGEARQLVDHLELRAAVVDAEVATAAVGPLRGHQAQGLGDGLEEVVER
jgi:hypothetical protein